MKHPFPKLRIMDLSHSQFSGNLPIEYMDSFKVMVNSDAKVYLHTVSKGPFYTDSVSINVKGSDAEVKNILNLYASIDLSRNMFNGEISEFIGELKFLRLLNLSHNNLKCHIPSTLGNMSHLESLDFSSNQLSGTIPWQSTLLTSLQILNLSENLLSGVIPQERHFDTFDNNSFLGNLALCGAPLTKKCKDGELPTGEMQRKPLVLVLFHVLLFTVFPLKITSSPTSEAEVLVYWKNSLLASYDLDSWSLNNLKNLCNWTGITCNAAMKVLELVISNHELNGTLAHFNFSLYLSLTKLDMSNNHLSASIPEAIGNATQLQILSLSFNYLNGNIPSSISQLREHHTLDLRNNHLSSTIPPELGLCTKLNRLDLSCNSLTGPLPLSMSNLTQINVLNLNNNYLSGEISSRIISNWTDLELLQTQSSTFTGNIPHGIGMLTNLTGLYLYSNNLTGPIPGEIGNLKKLFFLDLSENHITGSIPPTTGNLTKLEFLFLFSNNLSGRIPPQIGNLNNLKILILYSNNLGGTIPPEIGNLTLQLGQLDLNNNQLHGLGVCLVNNSDLHCLTGEIPAALCIAGSLELLDLCSNSLSGVLPHYSGDFNIQLAIMDLHENLLQGTIPPMFNKSCQLTTLNMNTNNFEFSVY